MNSLKLRLLNAKSRIRTAIPKHVDGYGANSNLNYHYSYGFLLVLFFALQVITGIVLAMHYKSGAEAAFDSVRHIMVNVKSGYLPRYMHSNGASFIFALMYLHIGRGVYFRSYLNQRKWIWWSGVLIFLLMMATAFIGYVLPWGQMSLWGATVITNLVTAIPVYGQSIAQWIWGGYGVSGVTLTRFYSLHYFLPFLIAGLIAIHILLLHQVGSSNPLESQSVHQITFSPAFIIKDLFVASAALTIFFYIVFFQPNWLGHPDNYTPADPMITPAHIVPEWYFTPFYAILRAFSDKTLGIIFMGLAILVLMLLPFIRLTVNGIPSGLSLTYKIVCWIFFMNFLTLMFLGSQPVCEEYVVYSQICTGLYFLFFIFCFLAARFNCNTIRK